MKFLFTIFGRIGRKKYWIATLIAWSIYLGNAVISNAINPNPETVTTAEMWIFFLSVPVAIWIAFAAGVQRMHDRGKSGLWLLPSLIPVIGSLWLFIELGFLEGDQTKNIYGEPDKA